MLLNFFQLLKIKYCIVYILKSLKLRSFLSFLTSFLISFILYPSFIRYSKKFKYFQKIRKHGPITHLNKNIPTMGGIIIILSIYISCMFFGDLYKSYLWILLYITIGFGIIGLIDDYYKIFTTNGYGLSMLYKYILQSIVSLIFVYYLHYCIHHNIMNTMLVIPFFNKYNINLGYCFLIFSYLIVVGSSNAINITDGLDGLVILPIIIIACIFWVIFCIEPKFSIYSNYFIRNNIYFKELSIFCSSIVGSGLGFLWYNTYPAQIFMGDVGSLFLGSALGILAIMTKQEIIFFIVGFIFIMEILSIILQICFFKYTKGKRLFLMSPLHHHFELRGYTEPKIVVRFWIISIIFAIFGLFIIFL